MTAAGTELDVYLSSFAELEKRAEPAWLKRLRTAAMDRFVELGFPTSRDEDWRFTSVAPIAKIPFRPAASNRSLSADELDSLPLAHFGGPRLVFINGHFSAELSTIPQGIRAGSLADAFDSPLVEEHLARYARYEDHAFVALNTAFLRDGAFIEVAKGTVVEKPIHLLFVTTGSFQLAIAQPRVLILVGRDSQANFIESYLSLAHQVYFTNVVTELVLGENAVVEHYKMQQEGRQAFHVATIQIQQSRSSVFASHNISLGGALVRNDLNGVLADEGAEANLNGLYIAGTGQHVDNHSTMDHAKPHCASREVYKGILDGRASAVFNGKIIVRPDAQKTDAKQTNKNLLLSEDATINTKPQLEIYADDVKCTHGATIGQLGEELVFYLRSRGIGYDDARKLLTYAFATDVTDRMKVESVRTRLDNLLLAWLQKGPGHKELV